MKEQIRNAKNYWHVMLMCIIATVAISLSSCSSDGSEPTPKPNPKDNGEITFTIDLPSGSGDGSSSSPAVVRSGETLSMAISQRSTYTDPDGTMFTCEPKAVIQLSAKADTVYAKDIKSLTKAGEAPEVRSSQTGTSPVCNKTVQTFSIGGQHVVFDLSHEVYTYTSSTKERIEMPYVRLNPAQLGGHSAKETRTAAVVTGVTVRPLGDTRAMTITDSTMYEVSVRFSMDIESMNAKKDTRQTLEFAVSYVGVVETVTELKDPVSKVSYVWDVKGGTKSTASPFVKTKGTAMEVWLAQTCSYTDEYGNEATAEPKAKVRLTVERDTVWTKEPDELKTLAEKTKGAGDGQSASQKFGSALQGIDVEWSYETGGEAVLAGKTIPMPYYSLSPVKLKDVSMKKLSDETQTINGKFFDLYEVTVTFSQQAVARNVTTGDSEVETEYVVSYIGAVEIYLVNVEYYPSGKWVDPHDNMSLAFFAKVERYRTYSNGKRIGPDEFYDYGHFILSGIGVQNYLRDTCYKGGEWLRDTSMSEFNEGDSILVYTQWTEVSRLAETYRLDVLTNYYAGTGCPEPFDWAVYRPSILFDKNSFISAADVEVPGYAKDSRAPGWYYIEYRRRIESLLYWDIDADNEMCIARKSMDFVFYDQFLVIDGRRITFSKQHNLKIDISYTEKDFEEKDKKGKALTLEMRATYLGKNFRIAHVSNVYVKK